MVYDLKNKVVLITGAATGIGAGVVRFLLDEGVKHVAILDVAEDAGIALQTELNSKYGANEVKFFHGDVTSDDDLNDTFKSVIDDYGYIDVVINNAGILNDSLQTYKKQIDINVTALVTGTLKALELMRKDQGGRGGTVINISSVAAMVQTPLTPIYSATKSAVLQFSNCIGLEEYYLKTGVRVITVSFGVTDTPLMSKENMGSYDQEIEARLHEIPKLFPTQRMESAARGVVEACKRGESGSTWLVENDKPAKDITEIVRKAYGLLTALLSEV